MDHASALLILELEDEASLEQAEQVFALRSSELERLCERCPPTSTERAMLETRLEELSDAIRFLRNPSTSVERAAAFILEQARRESEPDPEPGLEPHPEAEDTVHTPGAAMEFAWAVSAFSALRARVPIVAMAALAVVATGALLLKSRKPESPVSAGPVAAAQPSQNAAGAMILPAPAPAPAPEAWARVLPPLADAGGSLRPVSPGVGGAAVESALPSTGYEPWWPDALLRDTPKASPGNGPLALLTPPDLRSADTVAVGQVETRAAAQRAREPDYTSPEEKLDPAAGQAARPPPPEPAAASVARAAVEPSPTAAPVSDSRIDGKIRELHSLGLQAISRFRLTLPEHESALQFARDIDALESGRPESADLRAGIRRGYLELAERELSRQRIGMARKYAGMAGSMGADVSDVESMLRRIEAQENELYRPMRSIEEVSGLSLVVIPKGDFVMGSRQDELRDFAQRRAGFLNALFQFGGVKDIPGGELEQTARPVSMDSNIAISRSEITVAQFDKFIQSSGYLTDAARARRSHAYVNDVETEVAGRNWRHDYLGNPALPDQPVIHVSFRDATAFTRWLSAVTNARYRLPNEREFEYAARAGASGLTPWEGKHPASAIDNFRGSLDRAPTGWESGRDGRVRVMGGYGDGAFGPAEVGGNIGNAFGLENMLGNVAEWTSDCAGAASDGGQDVEAPPGGCPRRVVRGADWASDVRAVRLTYRRFHSVDYSSNRIGFRVVREYGPSEGSPL